MFLTCTAVCSPCASRTYLERHRVLPHLINNVRLCLPQKRFIFIVPVHKLITITLLPLLCKLLLRGVTDLLYNILNEDTAPSVYGARSEYIAYVHDL